MDSLPKPLMGLIGRAKTRKRRRIVVAAAEDTAVLLAVKKSIAEGLIDVSLIGNLEKIQSISEEIQFPIEKANILHEENPIQSAVRAVQLIKAGEGEILMKGYVSTAGLLKAVLDKENGLKRSGLLSHFALFEVASYPKLFGITDAAMNISPDISEKTDIINNAVEVMHRLGVSLPKVALLGPVETVNPKIESTVHAAMLYQMNRRGQITGCEIDGPLALDNAISKEAAQHKGIHSNVAGAADILVVPDLDAGNILYKSLIFMASGITAAIITGASVPIVLTSRADSEESKFLSIALAAAMD